jgi:hypothetical protein
MKRIARLILYLLISFTLIEAPVLKTANAGMISTAHLVEDMTRAQNQQKVIEFIERSEVKNQLISLGVSAEEASLRVAQLSDSELRQISGEIDNSMAGGDVGGVLVIILVVLLILYLVKRI